MRNILILGRKRTTGKGYYSAHEVLLCDKSTLRTEVLHFADATLRLHYSALTLHCALKCYSSHDVLHCAGATLRTMCYSALALLCADATLRWLYMTKVNGQQSTV